MGNNMNGYGAVKDPNDTKDILGNPAYYSKEVDAEDRRRYTTLMSDEGRSRYNIAGVSFEEAGRKFDGGKPQYGLIPPAALKETVKVLTLGASKYDKHNWKKVPDAQARYYDALQRHLWDWFSGEQTDPETGINHLAHAACNIMFLLERDLASEEKWAEIVSKSNL